MRAGLAALVALPLALAACTVNVEGAPCGAAGTTGDCPPGQACGNDGKCSERAVGCLAPESRCTPGETRCGGANDTERAERCTSADPVCGAWAVTPCAPRGLACGRRSEGGAAACECPAALAGPELAADPLAGSAAGKAPFPTGAASPAECRFRSLGDALASAGALAASGPATVRAYRSDASQVQVVFDAVSGDGPIAIPANVAVVGAADAAATVLRVEAATATPLVTLQGQLERFRIEGAAASGAGVATSCGSEGRPSLRDVGVDGGGALAAGIDVSGTCGADLTRATVANVAGPALRVHADPSALVTVQGGALRSSEVGARVTSGKVTFGVDGDATKSVEISGNAKEGLVVTTGAATDARLHGANIHGNSGTGVVVELASAGSAITMRGCDVSSNGRGTPRTYGPGTPRAAGGVLVAQGSLPFTFLGNRIYGNAGDQLAFESSASWTIAPSACGASSNVFACTEGAYAVAVAAGGTVDASYTVWPAVPFTAYMGAGVTIAAPPAYCNGMAGVPPTPACPAP